MPSSPAVPRPIVWQLSKTHLDWVWHSDNLHFQQRRQTSREYQSLLMLKSLMNARIIQGTLTLFLFTLQCNKSSLHLFAASRVAHL